MYNLYENVLWPHQDHLQFVEIILSLKYKNLTTSKLWGFHAWAHQNHTKADITVLLLLS